MSTMLTSTDWQPDWAFLPSSSSSTTTSPPATQAGAPTGDAYTSHSSPYATASTPSTTTTEASFHTPLSPTDSFSPPLAAATPGSTTSTSTSSSSGYLSASPPPQPTPRRRVQPPILTLPPELLSLITLFACSTHPTGPPVEARRLCLTCRAFNDVLSLRANAPLYVELFAQAFDTRAPKRRWAKAREAGEEYALDGESGDLFHPPERVIHELKHRWTSLTRIRRCALTHRTRSHLTQGERETDLWVALLLLLESDSESRNTRQLKEYARVDEYVGVFWRERLLSGSFGGDGEEEEVGELPEETVERRLGLWVMWMVCEERQLTTEPPLIQHAALHALRPYAFAAHRYDIFAAPWWESVMPLLPPPPPQPAPHPSTPHSQPESSTHSTPSSRQRSNSIDALFGDSPPPSTPEPPARISYFGSLLPISPPPAGLAAIMLFSLRTSFRSSAPHPSHSSSAPAHPTAPGPTSPQANPARHLELVRPPFAHELARERGSEAWDGDWRRMVGCWDLFRGRGLGVGEVGVEGVWEGKFTFMDFDSYRDMLTGSARSVYEGAFAEQPQVWRITSRRLPIPSSAKRQILSERRERASTEGEMTGVASVLEDAGAESGSGSGWGWPEEEVVLEGSGHSAWGEFNLVGKVRTWDGLVSLRKEYTPAARGTWLYRGYLVGDNYLVGRWRDTFTEKTQDGYEGIFALARRS